MTDVCRYLLTKTRANIYFQGKYGETALHWATHNNMIQIANILRENGCDDLDASPHGVTYGVDIIWSD